MPDPIAYIRRSVAHRGDPGDVSREFQTEKVRSLAGPDGATMRVIDCDWGQSAGYKNLDRREGFLSMLASIERGEVSAVYAYSLDRLARDVIASERLLRACRTAGAPIVTSEGRFDPNNDGSDMTFSILAVMNQNALRQMERKAQESADRVRARAGTVNPATGEEYRSAGRKSYGSDPDRAGEDVGVIMDAYKATGSFLGTAVRLNEQGVPTRLGGLWSPVSVSRIVRRVVHAREAHPYPLTNEAGTVTCTLCLRGARKGHNAAKRRMFAGMLRCQCGGTLTSMARPGARSVGYVCPNGRVQGTAVHGPYQVSEAKVLRWAEQQMNGMHTFVADHVALDGTEAITARLAELSEKRARIVDMYADGTIDKVERDRRIALVAAERARAQASLDVRTTGPASLRATVDWSADPAVVNTELCKWWQYIVLNGGMAPKRAVWVPTDEWGEEGPDTE